MMKYLIVFSFLIVFALESANADSVSPLDEKMKQFSKTLQQLVEKKDFSEIQAVLSEIDSILQTELNTAITFRCWLRVLGRLRELSPEDIRQTGAEKYLWNVTKLDIESIDSKLRQIDLLRLLLRPGRGHDSSDEKMNSKRSERIDRLIEIVMELHKRFDPAWKPNDPKNSPVSESKIYRFISYDPQLQPDPIREPEEFKKYEKFCRAVAEYRDREQEQGTLARFFPKYLATINEMIIEAYSIEPRANKELISLLEKSSYPKREQIKILCELKIPYKGFRTWESTDGLFKTEAKFIFYDAKVKEATLEKANGKQTTIEWSALRKEDQEYIRRQIELDQKKLKD